MQSAVPSSSLQGSLQEQAREAYMKLIAQVSGPLGSSTMITALRNRLHRDCGFMGTLRTARDLLNLTDEQAEKALEIIPTLQLNRSSFTFPSSPAE